MMTTNPALQPASTSTSPPTSAPINTLLQQGLQGTFAQDFVGRLAAYLTPEEVVDLSITNKSFHTFLNMRTPAQGMHPVIQGEHQSPIESVFYQGQEAMLQQETADAMKWASRKMRRYLPILPNAPFLAERVSLRTQYREVAAGIARLNVRLATLEQNGYLTTEQKVGEQVRLRAEYVGLKSQSRRMENRVMRLMLQMMDHRDVRLQIESEFFEPPRRRRRR